MFSENGRWCAMVAVMGINAVAMYCWIANAQA